MYKPSQFRIYQFYLLTLIISFASWLPVANAYEQYSQTRSAGNCAECHGDFRASPYISLADGVKAKVIDEQEAEAVRAAITARKLVIQVDDFPPEYFTKEQNAWGIDSLDGVAGQSM